MDENGKENKYSPSGDKTKEIRNIDILTMDVREFWGKTFVFIQKTKIKTWQGIFALAFLAGTATSLIWIISLDIQNKSDAAQGASLMIFTDDTAVTVENGSNLVNMDILLDSHSNNVTVVKAVVNYDPQYFELQSWTTDNSVFANDNNCSYNSKPCEIIVNDSANGKIAITVAKPSPGVNTASGIIGQLVFKALQITSPTSPNITLDYTAGHYDDSDIIADDATGSDILSSVTNAQVTVSFGTCTSFNYSSWGECQPSGTQTRTVISGVPSGCTGGTPVTQQNCTYDPQAPTCTSFDYSTWGECQPDGTQTRTYTGVPSGCAGGATPVTQQNCTYTPPTCTSFNYSSWGDCQSNGTQTRTYTGIPSGCAGGNPNTQQSCTYNAQAPTCTSFTYSPSWGECQPNGTQTRTILTREPTGCTGGTPADTQSCQYTAQVTTPATTPVTTPAANDDEEDEDEDKEDPKFTDLPLFLTKRPGEMIWWKATDNKGIDHYRYKFNGREEKTKKKHFSITKDTPKGLHILRVRAYDKAGNTKRRIVTILVR